MSHLYDQLMEENSVSIVLNLDLEKPIEINDFVAAFAGFGGQFERYIKNEHPDLEGHVKAFIKEVRKGSIEAELIPIAYNTVITAMDHIHIAKTFVEIVSEKIGFVKRQGGRVPDANKTELTELTQILSGVANDPDGKATIKALRYKKGKTTTECQIEFDTKEARNSLKEIEAQFKEIEKVSDFDHYQKLLTFYQSNKKDGDKTGEKGIIEDISTRPLAVVYASDLAKERIKSEMLSGNRNIYKLGFFVDVNVQERNGKPVAYRIKAVNDVIELSEDE